MSLKTDEYQLEGTFNRMSKLYPIKDEEKQWKENFCFIQGSDPQFGLIQELKNPKISNWDAEIKLAEKAVQVVNDLTPRPKFFVICGDLVNAFPSQPEIRKEQIKTFVDIFSKVHPDIPIICVCGNHDVGNNPSSEDIDLYRKTFGPDYFTFWCAGVFFIVINSQYWANKEECKYMEDHENFVLENLLKCKQEKIKRVVVFQHIPWFTKDIDEDTEPVYFSLPKEIRKLWLDRFEESGIKAVFCGHYHRNAGGRYNNIEMVVTSAIGAQLGSDQSGLRIVKVYEDNIHHKYYSFDEFPKHIEF